MGGESHEVQVTPARSRLRTRVVLLFLAISLLPLVTVTHLAWLQVNQRLRAGIIERLWATADGRTRQIAAMLQDDLRDARTVAREPGLGTALQAMQRTLQDRGPQSPRYDAAQASLRDFLVSFAETHGYADVLLLAPDTTIVFSANRKQAPGQRPEAGSALARAHRLATERQDCLISDFAPYAPSGRQVAFMVAPVLKDGVPVGSAVLELDLRKLTRIVQDYSGLGETGETVVATRVGDQILFLAPTRHDPDAAFRRQVPVSSPLALPLRQASQGLAGSGACLDYRNTEVMAVWRLVPTYHWAVVVKMDTQEVFAPLRQLGSLFLGGALLLAVVVFVAALLLARSIVEPIRRLTQTARGLAKGTLTMRADVTSEDEIGELARTFNFMADRVEAHTVEMARLNAALVLHQEHLEETVQARTAELSATNAELRAARDEAEAASRAKTSFLANMSHELRTPLHAVLGFSEILRADAGSLSAEEIASLADHVHLAGARLLSLVDNVLTLTRLDSRAVTVDCDEIHVPSLLAQLVAEHAALSQEGGNSVDLVVPEEPRLDCIDAVKTTRVLRCLLDNACRFTRHGAIQLAMAREQLHEKEWLSLRVSDTGPGISPELAARLAQPFAQADDSLTRAHGGMGLGLAIAYRLCQVMGGHLEVESEEGRGSTFTVRLPVAGPASD